MGEVKTTGIGYWVLGISEPCVLRLFYWTLFKGFKLGIQSLYKDLSHLKF